jgi:hypothetical protein
MAIETIDAVRARNFHLLFEQFKEGVRRDDPTAPDRGMLRRFAAHLEMNPVYLSNLNTGSKTIGLRTAREIEARLKLPEGWMDTDHTNNEAEMSDDDLAFRDSVMAMYRQAPEASRAAVLRVLQALVLGKPIEDVVSTDKSRKKAN